MAKRKSPRAAGTNPRALGTNPRGKREGPARPSKNRRFVPFDPDRLPGQVCNINQRYKVIVARMKGCCPSCSLEILPGSAIAFHYGINYECPTGWYHLEHHPVMTKEEKAEAIALLATRAAARKQPISEKGVSRLMEETRSYRQPPQCAPPRRPPTEELPVRSPPSGPSEEAGMVGPMLRRVEVTTEQLARAIHEAREIGRQEERLKHVDANFIDLEVPALPPTLAAQPRSRSRASAKKPAAPETTGDFEEAEIPPPPPTPSGP
jgi:hypothetical protein